MAWTRHEPHLPLWLVLFPSLLNVAPGCWPPLSPVTVSDSRGIVADLEQLVPLLVLRPEEPDHWRYQLPQDVRHPNVPHGRYLHQSWDLFPHPQPDHRSPCEY